MINMVRLGDLFEIKKGKKMEETEALTDDSIRYLQIEDLRKDSNIKYCKRAYDMTFAYPEDILIAWDGANAGTVNYGLEGAVGSTLAVLRAKEQMFIPFIGKYLQSKQKYLRDLCTGATIPHICRNVLDNIQIPLPPLDTQKKIAAALDKARSIISMRQEQIAKMDEFLQSVFLEMFGDPVQNSKGWRKEKLGRKCDIFRGGSPRPISKFLGGSVPWIKISDGTKGDSIYLHETNEFIIEEGVSKSRFVKEGNMIFANCGVSLGFARILKLNGCIHDGWLSFENISLDINKIFLLKLLNNCTDYFRKIAPDGTQPNLNTTIMKSFEIILPPLPLQNKFAQIVEKAEQQKELLRASLTEMETLFQSIMQKAFRGELFQ